jgi:hypothetical protein
LAGWLAGALGLPPEAMHPVDAERTAVRIGATPSDRQGTFASEQVAGDRQGRVVRVTASAGTTDTAATAGVGPTHRRIVRLGPQTLAAGFERALSAAGGDPAWRAALVTAADISSRAPNWSRGTPGPPVSHRGT